MQIDISNKVIVVTGSSRGIGSEMVKKFAAENANVVINYHKSREDAVKLYDEVIVYNQRCILVEADVTKSEEVNKLMQETLKAFKKIDVLINNAGICDDNLLPLMSERQWNHVINTNLNSVFLCSRIFSKEMIKEKSGKIFNIASLKGQLGSEGQTNYSASKAGVIGFTKALAKELGRYNICINAISPGFIITDLNRRDNKKSEIAANMNIINNTHNLNDLLDFLIFACSDHFKSVSGRVFNLDSRLQ